MRTVKIIAGLGCFVAALLPGILALAGFSNLGTAEALLNFCIASALAVLTIGLVLVGWFLITRRNLPTSKQTSVLITLIICLFFGIVVAVVIPNFVRARNTSAANACINNLRQIDAAVKKFNLQMNAEDCIKNLRQIDAAKKKWVLEHNGKAGDVVTEYDLTPYTKSNSECDIFPTCPQGGAYTIGKIGEPPTCSLGTTVTPAHVLP